MHNVDTSISVAIVSIGAIAITEPDSGFPVGGSELQLYLLARKLAEKEGFRPTLYVADVGQSDRDEGGLVIRPLVRMDRSLRLTVRKALVILRRLVRERHQVYVTRSASGINGLVRLAARCAGGRHLHMCAHDNECTAKPEPTLSRMARRLHSLAMRRADVLTCQTETQRTALRTHYQREAVLVPNLMPTTTPQPSRPRKGALWVGRDVDWKRPDLFVELASRLSEHLFTMVCQTQPGRDINRLRVNAPENLTLIPGLPFEETNRRFGTHQVFVSTSTAEGFPNTFLQAAGAGTPIVSLSVDPDAFLSRRHVGFCCNNSMEKAEQRIQALMTDPDEWSNCHEACVHFAAQRERENRSLATLVTLCENLIVGSSDR